MASFDPKLLNLMAGKLGINSEKVLKKASEHLRLLQLRVTASNGLRQFSDTSRVVMCLDLASTGIGYPFNKTDVQRFAGLNKKQYLNGLRLIESLLDLSKPVTVKTLCVQLGVSEVASCAQKIIDRYVELHSTGPKGPVDVTLPVYHCVAVLLACKHNKTKVEKPKLVEASRVKKVAFDKLVDEFLPVLETLGSHNVKTASKRPHKLIVMVSNNMDKESRGDEDPEKTEANDSDSEDFEAWKKRILLEAGEDT